MGSTKDMAAWYAAGRPGGTYNENWRKNSGSNTQPAGSTPASGSGGSSASGSGGTPAAGPPSYKHDDWVPILTNFLGFLLSVTETVYSCIEQSMDLAGALDKKARDNINITALIIDNSLITIVTGILCVIQTVNSAKIEIAADGNITLESAEQTQIYVNQAVQVGSPTSAIKEGVYKIKIIKNVVEIAQHGANFGTAITALVSQADDDEEETL
jgi:hypothetical protein